MESYSLDGIYHRMEEHACKKRFKNKLRITTTSSTAVCEISSKKKVRVELHIPWMSSIEFELDLAEMCNSWSQLFCVTSALHNSQPWFTHGSPCVTVSPSRHSCFSATAVALKVARVRRLSLRGAFYVEVYAR